MRVTDHVEVSEDHPRGGWRRGDGLELVQERRSEFRRGRRVDIGDHHGNVGGRGNKMGGESMGGGRNVGGAESRAGPRCQDATGDTDSRVIEEVIETSRKEDAQFERRDGLQLGFLK